MPVLLGLQAEKLQKGKKAGGILSLFGVGKGKKYLTTGPESL